MSARPKPRDAALHPPRVSLIGNPNVGKSVIFGLLSGRYTTVSNYPGTTVEVTRGTMTLGGRTVPLIDTPGANGLLPQSEDERVTRDLLLEGPTTVLQVADAKNLTRALALTAQIAEAGLPAILCLNMSDEAEARGISIDAGMLSRMTGVEVTSTVATRRSGVSRLPDLLAAARAPSLRIDYGERIERAVEQLEPLLAGAPIAPRALALAVLSRDGTLSGWIRRNLSPGRQADLEKIAGPLIGSNGSSMGRRIQQRRMEEAGRLAAIVTTGGDRAAGGLARRLGALTMHPASGLPVAALVLVAIFLFVGVLGAQTAVGWLEEGVFGSREVVAETADPGWAVPAGGALTLRDGRADGRRELGVSMADAEAGRLELIVVADPPGALAAAPRRTGPASWTVPLGPVEPARVRLEIWSGWINPVVRRGLLAWSPSPLLTDLIAGPYGLLTMGITYAVAIVLPIVLTFFLAFSVLEDSGYLPRLAVTLNRFFRLMGLNGRAVLPMVLGLGCDTMATLTTRILATRKERLIVVLLLALGVPCSAQLGVVLGMLAALSWKAAVIWSGVVALVIGCVGFLASRVIPGPRSEFVMEIPPLRWPSPANLLRKTLARVEWYVKEAVPLFLLGTLVLFVADRTSVLAVVERAAEPIVTRLLGLPAAATEAFVIGFLRRDFGAAGLYRLASEGRLDGVQILVSLITMTLFIPCIANFFMIVKEQGLRVAVAVAAFIFPFAILVGAATYHLLRLVGASLT